MNKKQILIASVGLPLISFFSSCGPGSEETETEKPNILIFFSDELAPEYLGSYGGDISTPNLDKLADNGTRFTNAYAVSSMSTPSRYSLLTGKYPGRCQHEGFLESFPDDVPYSVAWNTFIGKDEQTMAKTFSQHGYVTGMVGKWHISEVENDTVFPEITVPVDFADKTFNQQLQAHQETVAGLIREAGGFDVVKSAMWENYEAFPVEELRYHNFEWMTHGAKEFISEQAENDKPFLLYLATTAVHGPTHQRSLTRDVRHTPGGFMEELAPYQEKRSAMHEQIKDLPSHEQHLLSGMWFLDNHVGEIMALLEEKQLIKNTLVIFMADHNIEPGKATCYEKGVHVPFIISWPGKTKAGTTRDQLVQNTDIFPTILSAAGIQGENLQLDGKDLVPLFGNDNIQARGDLYFEAGYSRAVSNGRFKYIAYHPPKSIIQDMKSGQLDYAPNYMDRPKQGQSQIALTKYPHYFDPDQLYDLKNDPYEINNLANDPAYADTLKSMKARLQEITASFGHPYNWDNYDFMKSEEYKELAGKTRSWGTDYIYWIKSDHGEILWPPVEK